MIGNISKSKGFKGDKGDTPVRGVDYWTEDDKAEVVNEVKDMKKPDWNQNDELADGFIKNRTHYEHTKTEEISIEWQSDMPVDVLGVTKWVAYPTFSTKSPLVNGEVIINIESGEEIVLEVSEEGSATIGADYYLFEDYGNGTYGYTLGYPYEASEKTGTYAQYSRKLITIVPIDEKYLPPDFVALVGNKEDKVNKINSWDEYTPDMDGAEQYPSINMMMNQGSTFANQTLADAMAYVDVAVGKVDKRVTTNEQSIAGAFGAIQGVENRVGDLEVAESNLQDKIISLENKDVEIERVLASCEKLEHISSTTLTEEVAKISPTLNGRYKEIYWVFDVRAEPNTTKTEKGRLFLFPLANPANTSATKLIQQTAPMISVYKSTDWRLWISVKMVGNYAYSELWWNSSTDTDSAYGIVPDLNTNKGIVIPFRKLTKDYIDELSLWMGSADNSRVFPVGTTYELWGVKAE